MNRTRRGGFTLLELSIVLTLIGVIIGGGLAVFTASIQTSQFNLTVARMDAIDKAILNYTVASSRVPCPSNLTYVVGNTNFGVEAANPGSCTGGTPAATHVATSGTAEGGVPTRTLRLPDEYAYDGWGHAFRYAVDPVYTVSLSLPVGTACSLHPPVSTSAITVYDVTGTNARSNAGVYAVVSHGANGHGAYTSGGVMMSAGSDNANELVNCHCTSAAAASTYTATYVQQAPTLDSSDASDSYDDIVSYKEAWQLQAPNYGLTGTPQCYVYVIDGGNNRVEVYNTNGTYSSQFSITESGSHGMYIAIDSAGNIWLSNLSNSIEEFSNTGTLQYQYGSSGTAYGKFSSPEGIAFDINGNMWVADNGNNRVQECTTSGATLTCNNAVGAGYNSVAGSTGASGSGAGQLNGPTGIAIDKSGDLWVIDYGNTRLNEYSSTGTYMSTISLPSSPMGIAFDINGNLWVTEGSYNLQEYSPTGSLSTTFSSSGSGNGQFNGIAGISVDSSQNLWVVDTSNKRVQELSSSQAYENQFGPTSGAQQFSSSMGGIVVGR